MQIRTLSRFGLIAAVLVGALEISCGASRGASPLDVNPEAPTLTVGERIQIQGVASDEVAGELEWEVAETHGGGLLQSKGALVTYVAPPSAGTFHLVLRAPRVGGGTVKLEIPVLVRPLLKMEPTSAQIPAGGAQHFLVRQKGLPRGIFTWSLDEPEAGTIGSDGVFHASGMRGTFHVTATSTEDKDAVITATVTVQ